MEAVEIPRCAIDVEARFAKQIREQLEEPSDTLGSALTGMALWDWAYELDRLSSSEDLQEALRFWSAEEELAARMRRKTSARMRELGYV